MQPTQADLEPDILHADAIADLLGPLGYPVYQTEAAIPDEPDFPYLFAPAGTGEPFGPELLAGYGREVLTRHQITVAALTENDVIGVCARVRNRLHRADVTIPGRRTGDVFYEAGTQTQPLRDRSVTGPLGQPIYVAYATFTLCSTPDPT